MLFWNSWFWKLNKTILQKVSWEYGYFCKEFVYHQNILWKLCRCRWNMTWPLVIIPLLSQLLSFVLQNTALGFRFRLLNISALNPLSKSTYFFFKITLVFKQSLIWCEREVINIFSSLYRWEFLCILIEGRWMSMSMIPSVGFLYFAVTMF